MGGRKERKERKESKKENHKEKKRGRKRRTEEEGNRTSVVQWSDPNKLGKELRYKM